MSPVMDSDTRRTWLEQTSPAGRLLATKRPRRTRIVGVVLVVIGIAFGAAVGALSVWGAGVAVAMGFAVGAGFCFAAAHWSERHQAEAVRSIDLQVAGRDASMRKHPVGWFVGAIVVGGVVLPVRMYAGEHRSFPAYLVTGVVGAAIAIAVVVVLRERAVRKAARTAPPAS